jgi:hypothetical protein
VTSGVKDSGGGGGGQREEGSDDMRREGEVIGLWRTMKFVLVSDF